MKRIVICLSLLALTFCNIGCSGGGMSEEETKKSEQEMEQLGTEISQELPAKID